MASADASEWLAPEIEDLRAQVREAEAKVAEFRANSNLLMGQNNSTLVAQQLSELSSELSRVRADRAAAVAKAEEVRAALENGGAVEAMSDVMSAPLVQRLVERRVQLDAEIADLSTTLLDNHPRIRSLRRRHPEIAVRFRAGDSFAELAEDYGRPQEEIEEAISGNICRCTGYTKIIDAIQVAAERLQERS